MFNNEKSQNTVFCSLLAFILFFLYVLTAPHVATLEDAGEFILMSYFQGIAHPPGYPLFVGFGKLFSLLPFGSVAFRVSLLDITLGIATCILIYWISVHLFKNKLGAFFTALGIGISQTFWFFSITAEKYMLNGFLFCLILLLSLQLREQFSKKRTLILAFLGGLSLSNHWPLMVLASPSILVLLWPVLRDQVWPTIQKSPVFLLLLGLCFALGLSPYLHLLFAYRYSDYNFSGPIDGLQDLFNYVTRKEYANADQGGIVTWLDTLKFLYQFLLKLFEDFQGLSCLLILGGWTFLRPLLKKDQIYSFVLAFLSSTVFLLMVRRSEFSAYNRDIYMKYHLIPIMVFGLGMNGIFLAACKKINFKIIVGLISLCVIFTGLRNYSVNNISKDTFASDFAKIILESLPSHAVLLVHADEDSSPIAYSQLVQKVRPDIRVVSQASVFFKERIFNPRVDFTSESRMLKILQFIQHEIDHGNRVFTTARIQVFDDQGVKFPLYYISHGLYEEISDHEKPAPKTPEHSELLTQAQHFLDDVYQKKYPTQWYLLRNRVVGSFCRVLIENGQNHPLINSVFDCQLTKAQWLYLSAKDYVQADHYYSQVIHKMSGRSKEGQIHLMREFLLNRLQIIKNPKVPNEEKLRLLQEVVSASYPYIDYQPTCNNQFSINILEIINQVPVQFDRQFFEDRFSNCRIHRQLLQAIQPR